MAAGSFLFVVRALAGAAAFARAECAVIVEAFRRPCTSLRGFGFAMHPIPLANRYAVTCSLLVEVLSLLRASRGSGRFGPVL